MEELATEIRRLLGERNAILLSHNYQTLDIQAIADLRGDSLELARAASRTDAEVIVFAGVHFMAETASILNPEKTVLLPDANAGCPMADMITAQHVRAEREKHPRAAFVAYVNTTAEVKAESDICCTSANAVKVVETVDQGEVYMLPDKNLALYTARYTNKRVHYWDGFCIVHHSVTSKHVKEVKAWYPGALFIAHPECRPEVLDLADHVFSTSGMARFVAESDHDEFIIGTERGLMDRMAQDHPQKRFFLASPKLYCVNMKKITVEKIRDSLINLEPVVKVPEEVARRARAPIERMLEVV